MLINFLKKVFHEIDEHVRPTCGPLMLVNMKTDTWAPDVGEHTMPYSLRVNCVKYVLSCAVLLNCCVTDARTVTTSFIRNVNKTFLCLKYVYVNMFKICLCKHLNKVK